MASSRVILGIDMGSTKITTVVGEMHSSRGLVLRGLRTVPTTAISRGTVRDLNQVAQDIDLSFSGAMFSSGLAMQQVYVGITGRGLTSVNGKAMLEIAHPEGEVTREDVELAVAHSRPQDLEPGQQVVHSIVREFILDGIRINRSPVGMIGERLGVENHIVLGSASQIANLERALERVELTVRSYVFNLIAASEAVLSAEDRNAGCVLIDFGGGTTNVGVFYGGSLCFSRCIPIGSQNYDHDLKHGLGVSFEEAKRIKRSYGKAWLDENSDELEDFVDIKFYGHREYDKIKRRRIFEIMQPRTEEILELIIDALNDSGEMSRIAGGVILVGGGCQLRELRRYLQKYLQRQVRTGLPTGIGHLLDEYRMPAYAAPLGLLLYGAKHEITAGNGEPSFMSEVADAVKEIIARFLPGRGN
jgi:cell division protein FtsA